MSESTILKLERWVADTLKEDYEKLKEKIIQENNINADETSFKSEWRKWMVVGIHFDNWLILQSGTNRGHSVPEEVLKGLMAF